MIQNPILPGFNPDPCICRKGQDFYLIVSSFEWMPGLPVYHSRDLKHWELITHVLTDMHQADLRKLPSAKGIWAPCLTYSENEDLFYVVYGVMNSMNARYFDVDNFLITAKDIHGPWSEPVYLHSNGFDASILHDDDGRKYVVALDWETRDGYEKPGAICVAEYDPVEKRILDYPRRVYWGGTDRGCIEAPHLTKHNGRYYLMCAEGGTGYNHCVTMARSDSPYGPYEPDPTNPIVTSVPGYSNERADWDHLKPRYYNHESILQKSGHGSYVDFDVPGIGPETYLVHLTARPFVPELRCTLGRETAIQKMVWTEDGWLRMADGSCMAKVQVPETGLPEVVYPPIPARDDFDEAPANAQPDCHGNALLAPWYYAPRIMPSTFVDLTSRPGWLRMRGQESRTSLNSVSILARKLTSVHVQVTTKMDFSPSVHKESAGLILYYDNMNYVNLRKYRSDSLGQSAISVLSLENGERTEFLNTRTPVPDTPIWLRLTIDGRRSRFSYSLDGENYQHIGRVFDTTKFSDEFCKYGEFTGTMVGITCADKVFHRKCADFGFFEMVTLRSPVDIND